MELERNLRDAKSGWTLEQLEDDPADSAAPKGQYYPCNW